MGKRALVRRSLIRRRDILERLLQLRQPPAICSSDYDGVVVNCVPQRMRTDDMVRVTFEFGFTPFEKPQYEDRRVHLILPTSLFTQIDCNVMSASVAQERVIFVSWRCMPVPFRFMVDGLKWLMMMYDGILHAGLAIAVDSVVRMARESRDMCRVVALSLVCACHDFLDATSPVLLCGMELVESELLSAFDRGIVHAVAELDPWSAVVIAKRFMGCDAPGDLTILPGPAVPDTITAAQAIAMAMVWASPRHILVLDSIDVTACSRVCLHVTRVLSGLKYAGGALEFFFRMMPLQNGRIRVPVIAGVIPDGSGFQLISTTITVIGDAVIPVTTVCDPETCMLHFTVPSWAARHCCQFPRACVHVSAGDDCDSFDTDVKLMAFGPSGSAGADPGEHAVVGWSCHLMAVLEERFDVFSDLLWSLVESRMRATLYLCA